MEIFLNEWAFLQKTVIDNIERKYTMTVKAVEMLTYMFHFKRNRSTAYLKKFSNSKRIFKSISHDLRIKKIQTIESNDEIRGQIRSQLIECRNLIEKMASKYLESNEWVIYYIAIINKPV